MVNAYMTPITKQNIVELLGFEIDKKMTDMICNFYPDRVVYRSRNHRYVLQQTGNNIVNNGGWNLHIDNSAFESLASCDVEYIEQIEALIDIYKNY